jgi:hypothetical protein
MLFLSARPYNICLRSTGTSSSKDDWGATGLGPDTIDLRYMHMEKKHKHRIYLNIARGRGGVLHSLSTLSQMEDGSRWTDSRASPIDSCLE